MKQPIALALEDDEILAILIFLVGEFSDHGSMTWNVDKLYDYFDMDSVDIIMQILLNRSHGGERLI